MKRLPVIEHKGRRYFVDFRLGEFRPVEPPIEFIPFDSEAGREIAEMPEPEKRQCLEDRPITVECPLCGRVLFEGTQKEAKGLIIYCVDCWRKSEKKGDFM